MKLIIMRHGQAEWSAPSDAERPLSDQGKSQAESTANKINGTLSVSRVIASPYLRAQQTGAIVAKILGCSVDTMDELVPEGDPYAVIHALPEQEVVLLASHMPLVGELTGLLCEGAVNGGPSFHTGSAALIEYDLIGVGMGRLIEIISP